MKTDQTDALPRPKWLAVTLACLSAWLTFVFSFFLYAFVILCGVNALFRTDGLPGAQGIAVLIVIAGLSIVSAVFVAKWQQRLLARRSLRTNYIVLAVLIVLTLLFVPAPFTYTIM